VSQEQSGTDQQPAELAVPASPQARELAISSTTTSALSYRFADIPENRPIFADEQTYRHADLPDDRPIYIAQTYSEPPQFANNKSGSSGRPISASTEFPVEGAILPFHRPLFTSALIEWPTFTLSGERPVAPSALKVQPHPDLPNGRPIGSNHIDDYQELMGFID
jgi:hypothetical protein